VSCSVGSTGCSTQTPWHTAAHSTLPSETHVAEDESEELATGRKTHMDKTLHDTPYTWSWLGQSSEILSKLCEIGNSSDVRNVVTAVSKIGYIYAVLYGLHFVFTSLSRVAYYL